MLPVAVDAMGGDNAPKAIVEGAQRAIEERGIPVVLVGQPEALGDTGGIEVIEASEVIAMDADPGTSVRTMKDSSLVRAAEAVRCLLYTSPSPRDQRGSRMPSSA